MSKPSQRNTVQTLEELTSQAVHLAKQRRQRELTEEELASVSGGLPIDTIGILLGFIFDELSGTA